MNEGRSERLGMVGVFPRAAISIGSQFCDHLIEYE